MPRTKVCKLIYRHQSSQTERRRESDMNVYYRIERDGEVDVGDVGVFMGVDCFDSQSRRSLPDKGLGLTEWEGEGGS